MRSAAFIATALLLLASPVSGAVFNVNTSATFQAALTAAQSNGENDTITLTADAFTTSSNGGATFTYISFTDEDLVVNGASLSTSTVEGDGLRRSLLLSSATGDITLRDVGFEGGGGSGDIEGGALKINTGGSVTLTRVGLRFNSLSTAGSIAGGAAHIIANGITITGGLFGNDTITQTGDKSLEGGVMYAQALTGDITLVDVSVAGNTILEQSTGELSGALLFLVADAGKVSMVSTVLAANEVTESGDGDLVGLLRVRSQNATIGPIVIHAADITELDAGSIFGGAAHLSTLSSGGSLDFVANNIYEATVSEAGDGSIDGGLVAIVAIGNDNTLRARDNTIRNSSITEQSAGSMINGSLFVSTGTATNSTSSAVANYLFDLKHYEDGQGIESPGLVVRSASADSSTYVANNVILHELAETAGPVSGGIVATGVGNVDVINNTITANSATPSDAVAGGLYVSGSAAVNVHNNIGWDNQGTDFTIAAAGTLSVTRNNFGTIINNSGVATDLSDNLSVDPLLPMNDYHLQIFSPMRNAGTSEAVLPSLDIDLQSRTIGSAPDIGADEAVFTTENSAPEAVDDQGDTADGEVEIWVVGNDRDDQGGPLTVVSYTQGQYGTVVCDAEVCTYTPTNGSGRYDTFQYTVSDAAGLTSTGTVIINTAIPTFSHFTLLMLGMAMAIAGSFAIRRGL